MGQVTTNRLFSQSSTPAEQIPVEVDSLENMKAVSFMNNEKQTCEIPSLLSLKGIIFDMDGTLLHPCIDFASMRSQIYEIANRDEGELIKSLPETIEEDAIRHMKFMDDMVDLVKFLDAQGISRAVLTRNVERSLDAMYDKLWNEEGIPPFSPAVAKDTVTRTEYGYNVKGDIDIVGSMAEKT